jgi:hypothetical protein
MRLLVSLELGVARHQRVYARLRRATSERKRASFR